MPKEIRSILKAANIKKRHLKNKDLALKTFDIIQKALSSHTANLMAMFKERKESVGTSDRESLTNPVRNSE